jgi:glutamine amidotransferase
MDASILVNAVIVDFGLGNLYSVKHACEHVGIQATITNAKTTFERADVIILPGIGAFGDAIHTLTKLGLVPVLREAALSGKPLVGVCLGMQLLMSESHEFGRHPGLGLVEGQVVKFEGPVEGNQRLKVPQVGWNRIQKKGNREWDNSPLAGVRDGEFMYFVHSYYVQPSDKRVVLATTLYGNIEFCSSLIVKNIFATQFHPERSGPRGLQIYGNIAAFAKR